MATRIGLESRSVKEALGYLRVILDASDDLDFDFELAELVAKSVSELESQCEQGAKLLRVRHRDQIVRLIRRGSRFVDKAKWKKVVADTKAARASKKNSKSKKYESVEISEVTLELLNFFKANLGFKSINNLILFFVDKYTDCFNSHDKPAMDETDEIDKCFRVGELEIEKTTCDTLRNIRRTYNIKSYDHLMYQFFHFHDVNKQRDRAVAASNRHVKLNGQDDGYAFVDMAAVKGDARSDSDDDPYADIDD